MKKTILFLLICFPSLGCDICGCANSNSFFGLMPASNRKFIGLRYRQQSYDSHVGSSYLASKEDFLTTEIWTRFYPLEKLQVVGYIPYNFHYQHSPSGEYATEGIGDPSFLFQYNIINTLLDSTVHTINQNFLIGGGIKLPFGKFRYDESNPSEVANANFQLGTGSTDFSFNLTYGLRYNYWGVNLDGQYKLNTKNPMNYQFGNRISGGATLFYTYGKGHKVTLMPYTNLYTEKSFYDSQSGLSNHSTGGTISLWGIGTEFYVKKFMWGINYQIPIHQNIANLQINAKNRISAHVSWLF